MHAIPMPAASVFFDAPEARIDIVYLWVDGNDPQWRARRHEAARHRGTIDPGAMALYGNVEGRFRDNDELRYSLRALERHFPGHGHVYIVTDGQTPSWLRPSPHLSLVDHRDLIPASQLPTFDSAHIESYVHRIPGLSERFFYFNDDGSLVGLRFNQWKVVFAEQRAHGFDVARDEAMRDRGVVVARFAAGEDVREATSALNRVLCIAGGIRIHALAPRRRSLETLYRNAAKVAEPAALA